MRSKLEGYKGKAQANQRTDDITERLYSLLQGERVIARIDQNVVYRFFSEDPANICSLLLVAGYLKTLQKELQVGAITRTTANTIDESLIALMDNQYKIKSNRESGDGRYDISLFPREDRYLGIVMELK